MATYSDKEKMKLVESGKRKLNIKACKTAKLIWYYRVCRYLSLENTAEMLYNEIERRYRSGEELVLVVSRVK